jgi:anti-sigma regulatory factor (Ser/Thr protein kinase)
MSESEDAKRRTDRVAFAATFQPTPESVRAARSFVASHVPEGLRDRAVLLVSELASNAVVYAGTNPFEVRIRLAPSRRIEIRDASGVLPAMLDPSFEDARGRGLRIVEALADAWGVCSDENGKVVWFEF